MTTSKKQKIADLRKKIRHLDTLYPAGVFDLRVKPTVRLLLKKIEKIEKS